MPADPQPVCERVARCSERGGGAGEGADRDQAAKRAPRCPAIVAGPASGSGWRPVRCHGARGAAERQEVLA